MSHPITLQEMRDLLKTQAEIIGEALAKNQAQIRFNSDARPRLQLRIPIALDVASTEQNPFFISNPFNGFYVESATDSSTLVKLVLTSPEAQNMKNYTTVKLNDSGSFDQTISKSWLLWDSQPGKIMTLVFYLGVQFKPGSQNSVSSGGLALAYGSGMTPNASVSVTTAATLLFAASTARKKVTISNLTGAQIYLSGVNTLTGGSTVGNTIGVPVPVGGSYEWLNSGACYALTDSGTATVALNTEA